jgi:hypothetical protein
LPPHPHDALLCSADRSQVPTKSTDEHFFDGEWSVDGGRGPVTALKYMNKMTERPFFAAFNPEDSQAVVRKTPSFEPFKTKNDRFVKTGLGQTQSKS